MVFRFKSGAAANTAAVTVAISGLSTIAVQLNGSALVSGDIEASKTYELILDTTTTAQLVQIVPLRSVTAAFDTNNTQVATTAFVKQSGFQFSGFTSYTTTSTLTASDANKILSCGTTTPITLTLPAISALANGDTITIYSINTSPVTVQRAGTDTIHLFGNVSATQVILQQGDVLTLVQYNGSVWVQGTGSRVGRIKSKSTLTKTATGSLTATDLGKTLFANTASNITLTLPAANAGDSGECINITNINTGVVTVSRAGTDTINARGVAAGTSFTLGQGESTILALDGTSAWYEAARGANQLTLGTSVATTSGTSIDFTGIPAWAKRITVMLNGVSTNGTSDLLIQIGVSSTPTTTGYTSGCWTNNTTTTTSTAGFVLNAVAAAASAIVGHVFLTFQNNSNNWIESSNTILNPASGGSISCESAGVIALGGVLGMVRLTTVNGTDTFDAGSVNISWEG